MSREKFIEFVKQQENGAKSEVITKELRDDFRKACSKYKLKYKDVSKLIGYKHSEALINRIKIGRNVPLFMLNIINYAKKEE